MNRARRWYTVVTVIYDMSYWPSHLTELFLNGLSPASFLIYFRCFQTNNFYNICEKCSFSIRCWVSHPWPLEQEPPPMTTRPLLTTFWLNCFNDFYFQRPTSLCISCVSLNGSRKRKLNRKLSTSFLPSKTVATETIKRYKYFWCHICLGKVVFSTRRWTAESAQV